MLVRTKERRGIKRNRKKIKNINAGKCKVTMWKTLEENEKIIEAESGMKEGGGMLSIMGERRKKENLRALITIANA